MAQQGASQGPEEWTSEEDKFFLYLRRIKGCTIPSILHFFPQLPDVRDGKKQDRKLKRKMEASPAEYSWIDSVNAVDVFRVVKMHKRGSSWAEISSALKRSADDCQRIWNNEQEYKLRTNGTWLCSIWVGELTTLIDLDIYEVYRSVSAYSRFRMGETLLPYARIISGETTLTIEGLMGKFSEVDAFAKNNELILEKGGHLSSQKYSHVRFGWEETDYIVYMNQTKALSPQQIAFRLRRPSPKFSIQFSNNLAKWKKEVEERENGDQSSRELDNREWEREEENVLRHWSLQNMPFSTMSALLGHAVDEAKIIAVMSAERWNDETDLFPWKAEEEEELLKQREDGCSFEVIARNISRKCDGLFHCTVATMYHYDKLKNHEVGHSWKHDNNPDIDPNKVRPSISDSTARPRPEFKDSRTLQVPGVGNEKGKGAMLRGLKFPNMPIFQSDGKDIDPKWEPQEPENRYLSWDQKDSEDEDQSPIAESSKTHKRGASTQISKPTSKADSSSDQKAGSTTKQPGKKKAATFSFSKEKKGKKN
jgi:hypothetical protein